MESVASKFADEPLLLLMMPRLVAAFAFVTKEIEDNYGRLYGTFKTEFSSEERDWNDTELAFVVCVPADSPGLDQFRPTVETDVYFCRKYVVPFNGAPVQRAFAQLPFIPLFSGHDQEIVRPPSAQTFLQQCRVPPTLAKYIVVKGERSATRIVADCMEGSFGSPEASARPDEVATTRVPPNTVSMRIGTLEVENFRAYREKRTFSFGEDLTVLYGPNGFGKTSVFDALDFAFTGDIGRLGVTAEDRFQHVANHLEGVDTEGVVTLGFVVDGEPRRLVRRVNDRKSATIDGVSVSRKVALERLTGWRGSTADRVANLISLFRATHLFSQEYQELASNFRRECELSSDVVSRLLAFEDYHVGRNKIKDVCGVLRANDHDIATEIASLEDDLAANVANLETLGRAVTTDSSSTDWEDAVASLVEKIRQEGIEVSAGSPDLRILRDWRLTFETRAADWRGKIDDIRKCLGVVEKLPKTRAELEARQGSLDSAKAAAARATVDRNAAEAVHDATVAKISHLDGQLADLKQRSAELAWLAESVPAYRVLVLEEAETRLALETAQRRVNDADRQRLMLTERVQELETDRAAIIEAADDVAKTLHSVDTLLSELDSWTKRKSRLEEALDETKRTESLAVETGLSDKRLAESIDLIVGEEQRVAGRVQVLEQRHSEVGELVTRMEKYIEGGVCPVCGEDHGSPAELLERIAQHLGEEIAQEERLQAENLRGRRQQLEGELAQVQSDARRNDLRLQELARETKVLEAAIEEFERSLLDLDIAPFLTSSDTIRQELNALRDSRAQTAMELQSKSSSMLGDIQATKRDLAEANEEHDAATRDSSMRLFDQEMASTALRQLLNDPRRDETVGLDVSSETVSERRALAEAAIESVQRSLDQARQSMVTHEQDLRQLRADELAREGEVTSLFDDVARLEASCREMEATLESAGLSNDVTESDVLPLIESHQQQVSSVSELIRMIASMERIVDAATTKAAYTGVQEKVKLQRERLAELANNRKSHTWWLDYFETLRQLLSTVQDQAVSRFTDQYGPRTSAIQRRLRSVYGFDDVRIQSDESRILVRVSRQGERLRPTDYFSQSQQQTLLLGLFLTASVSQTWSKMAPIFLDDPVTHFDDLNTYAFLDLLDGLLNDEDFGGRQFVVSTCDERLLRLARRRFAYKGRRARFYTFKGIGDDGPIVV